MKKFIVIFAILIFGYQANAYEMIFDGSGTKTVEINSQTVPIYFGDPTASSTFRMLASTTAYSLDIQMLRNVTWETVGSFSYEDPNFGGANITYPNEKKDYTFQFFISFIVGLLVLRELSKLRK